MVPVGSAVAPGGLSTEGAPGDCSVVPDILMVCLNVKNG